MGIIVNLLTDTVGPLCADSVALDVDSDTDTVGKQPAPSKLINSSVMRMHDCFILTSVCM